MFKKVFLVLMTFAIPALIFAQSSGKIIGVVKDKQSGEPLPGVNVVLQDTYLGATTDVDGYYVIMRVPVSSYTVEASYIGYTKMIVQNVRVSADVTTEQNFDLSSTTLELGEAVVIVADRPLIEKHVTYSTNKVSSDEIQNAPIRGIQAFMATMPSIVVQDGAVNIRGGRGEEVGYYLDGASTMNPVNRTNAVSVIQEATEEMQVLTGGFGAEYGGANSGIVKRQLRQGTPDFHFSLTTETDKFADEGEKFLGTYSYRDHLIVATASGPITDNIKFFAAGEWNKVGDTQKRFSKGFTFNDKVDENQYNTFVTDGTPDTINISYPDGFTPNNWNDRKALNATISMNFDPILFRVSGIVNYIRRRNTNNPMRTITNDRWVDDINTNYLLSGKLTHVINPKTYYDVSINYYHRVLDESDNLFGNDWKKWSDSSAVAAQGADVPYRDAWRPQYNWYINGIPFNHSGVQSPNENFKGNTEDYDKSEQTYFGGGLDFVSQIGKHHELKFGFNAKLYTIRQYDVNPFMVAHTDPNYTVGGNHLAGGYYETLEDIPYDQYRDYLDNTYGYDYLGNEIDSDGLDGPRKPVVAAAYFTDKVEYEDLIINLGLRVDYFDADDRNLKSPDNADVDEVTSWIADDEWETVDAHIDISPRLGISFPVSETTVFYTQFGKFVQMPEFNDLYFNNYQYTDQVISGGNYFGGTANATGVVGYGFDPIYTTSYEIGLKKQFGEYAALDIAGFYKNIQGQIQAGRVVKAPGAEISTYLHLKNGDFATNKGLELKLTLRRFNRLQGQMSYTLTDAEGTGSGEIAYISAVYSGTQIPTILSPLDYSQTHRGSVILDYRFGQDDGGPVFEQAGINMIYTFNSGHPYTKVFNIGGQSDSYDSGVDYLNDTRAREAVEPINASTTPWVHNIDLRVDKSFNITEQIKGMVYMRVTNLLNTKNVINVYPETGSATDDGYITNPERYMENYTQFGGDDYLELYKALNTNNGASMLSQLGLDLWGQPRQIMFGLKFMY